jgi:hypothetical protein
MGLSAEKLLQATFRPVLEDVEECREALGAHWQRIVERGSV